MRYRHKATGIIGERDDSFGHNAIVVFFGRWEWSGMEDEFNEEWEPLKDPPIEPVASPQKTVKAKTYAVVHADGRWYIAESWTCRDPRMTLHDAKQFYGDLTAVHPISVDLPLPHSETIPARVEANEVNQ